MRTALLTLLLLAPAASRADDPEAPGPSAASLPGEPLDATQLAARIAAASGKVTVFNFWATWCQPCVTELPTLRAYAAAHPDVAVVLVNVDATSAQSRRVPPVIAANGLEKLHHVMLASENPAAALRNVVADWPGRVPTTLVVAADGTRRAMLIDSVSTAQLDAAVSAAK